MGSIPVQLTKNYNMMNDQRKMKVEWTPEMLEIVKKLKPFDYEKHEDEIKKHIKGAKGSGSA